MSKYEEFDKALIDLIANGTNTASSMECSSRLRALAEPHRTEDRFGKTPVFRIIDRRLQAMRKAGKIRFNNKNWEIVK